MMNRWTWVVALAASGVGCSKKDKDTKPAETAPAPAQPTEPAPKAAKADPTPAKPAADKPKADPGGVDAEIIAAAKKIDTDCKWKADEGYFESNCPAQQAYFDLVSKKTQGMSMDDGKLAPTFVAMIEDKSPGMQYLGADRLYNNAGRWIPENKELQEKIFAVATALPKDSKGGTANKLGCMIGFFHLDKTGLFDKAKALVDNAEAPEALRVGIVNWMLAGNPESDPAYELVRDQAQKGAPALKTAALVGLSGAYVKHATDEMCKLWIDALPKLPDEPASLVAAHITNGDLQIFNENNAFPWNWAMVHSDDNKCPAETVDAALKVIDGKVAAGKAGGLATWWVAAMKGPAKSKNATDAQKKKAVEIAKKFVDNAKYGGYERGSALEIIVDMDPAVAKTLADKYGSDKDAQLKSAAERVKKKLDEKKS